MRFIVNLPACVPALALAAGAAWAQPAKPNIVLIMADDLGFSDIGAWGSDIHTPNLDKLAKRGVRFTQFYNGSRCCPTRAALLTGLYAHQAGVGHMNENELATRGPAYLGGLNDRCVTLAQVARSAGYRTYMVGKWHVATSGATDKNQWPLQRGFDRFFGFIGSPGNYFNSAKMVSGNNPAPEVNGSYSTYQFGDTAVQYLKDHVAAHPDAPFFMYLPHRAPHFPLQAPDSLVAKYRGKYLGGPAALRKARLARQRASGLMDSSWTLSPKDTWNWDTLGNARKEEMDFRMSIYAAQVEALDQGIGQVLDALDRLKLADNTVVMFLSDNGGNAEGGLPGGGPASDLGKHATADFLTYSRNWSNLSNTPFREYKHFEFEGGISSPFIFAWPAGLARKDEWEKAPGHIIDIMPTLVELTGAKYPATFEGRTILPMEGASLLPALRGQGLTRKAPLFWEHEGNRAVRDGKWKLVADEGDAWSLYDMEADRTEQHDLAAQNPDRVKAMDAQWTAWANRVHVFDTPVNMHDWGRAGSHAGLPSKAAGAPYRADGSRLIVPHPANGVVFPGRD